MKPSYKQTLGDLKNGNHHIEPEGETLIGRMGEHRITRTTIENSQKHRPPNFRGNGKQAARATPIGIDTAERGSRNPDPAGSIASVSVEWREGCFSVRVTGCNRTIVLNELRATRLELLAYYKQIKALRG